MTPSDDTPRDDTPQGNSDAQPDVEPDVPLDEEAAWRLIVENYGERPEMGDQRGVSEEKADAPDQRSDQRPDQRPVQRPVQPEVPLLDRSFLDARDEEGRSPAARHEDEHFVPPTPPPVPRGTPARRLAWLGLFGAPLLMLAAVVFGWEFATWFSMMLVAAFVGGFVFLVATMPRDRDGDGWDDGAVL